MSRSVLSVKLKIVLTYVMAFVVVVIIVVTTGYLMRVLETRVVLLERVSRLEEKVQDLRRCEKNLFLYHDKECGRKSLFLINDARRIVASNGQDFERITSPEETRAFSKHLENYEQAMSEYLTGLQNGGLSKAQSETGQEGIREIGTSLLTYAEHMAQRKRHDIRKTIDAVNKLQLVQALFVAVGLLAFGGFVLGKIVHPLKSLQEHTQRIGQGDFSQIESPPKEHEIRDVFDALNNMSRELKKREQELLRSRHLVSLGTLLAGVAHELNNPLSNIRSTCEILTEDMDTLDTHFQKRNLKAIIQQVDKAGTIVRDLLELSRGKESTRESLNLKDLIARTLSLLHGRIPPEVEVVVNVADDEVIFADRQGILQAFMNVISNAVESIDGDGRITIGAQNVADGMVDVVIMDTGPGIEEQNLTRIFDPFFSTKDVGKGTGLGLFITHGIIEKHKGRVLVNSVLGKGTSFVLRIPVREESV